MKTDSRSFNKRARRVQMDPDPKKPVIAEDRISALPDSVLCHIFSCIKPEYPLVRKCVVRTSILSKRWKNLWAHSPNLYFDSQDLPCPADFIAFVDRALLVRDSTIQKLHLHFSDCQDEDLPCIADWISTAVRFNVVQLDLSVASHGDKMFELPESLLTCRTLMVWKLRISSLVKIPEAGCWSGLKELHLKFMYPTLFDVDNYFMDFSQFPVLEYLRIYGLFGFESLPFIISMSELKTLRINPRSENDIHVAHVFDINAPKLEKLDVEEELLSDYTFVNTRSLVEATVRSYDTSAPGFLAGIAGVKCLTISSPFLEACSMVAFDNVREFTVLEMSFPSLSLLTEVLGSLSNLESLMVEYDCYDPYCHHPRDSDLVIYLPASTREVPPEVLRWRPPESVPKCLVSHLKTICIKGFKGSQFCGYVDTKEVIKYLLKNGQVLQKMTIYSPGLCRVEEQKLNNELSMFEWGSKSCQVEVDTKVICRCQCRR